MTFSTSIEILEPILCRKNNLFMLNFTFRNTRISGLYFWKSQISRLSLISAWRLKSQQLKKNYEIAMQILRASTNESNMAYSIWPLKDKLFTYEKTSIIIYWFRIIKQFKCTRRSTCIGCEETSICTIERYGRKISQYIGFGLWRSSGY